MNIDEKGNNVLNGGTEEYQKWKYEIGENYGLNKAIRIIKKHCYNQQQNFHFNVVLEVNK